MGLIGRQVESICFRKQHLLSCALQRVMRSVADDDASAGAAGWGHVLVDQKAHSGGSPWSGSRVFSEQSAGQRERGTWGQGDMRMGEITSL